MHISALQVIEETIYLLHVAQIAALQWDKSLTKVLTKYANYVDVFSFGLAMEFSKNLDINEYAIILVKEKQSSYKPIYTLNLVKLKILKTYIKTHLKSGFI